jgi:drug/metabolite transporter (DMT)-like permease
MSSSRRLRSILQALLVTFLWSTSWILIKYALHEIPPLTFAGLRYTLAFIILLPSLWRRRAEIRALPAEDWRRLALLGFVYYTMTQGGQFVTLNHLEAVTFSLLLNFTSMLVAFFGIVTLREMPTRLQWGGIIVFVAGVLVYFLPVSGSVGGALGFALAGFTICANGAAVVLSRSVNRERAIRPVVVTATSMGIGGTSLLGIGVATEGLPSLSPMGWLIIAWLAIVNTALAFTLWNRSLQSLSAVESSVVNNTMLIQIAVLAWLFLGEELALREVLGLILAAAGILLASLRSN